MSIFEIALTILGLAVFETVSSIDNAVINAEVLSGMDDESVIFVEQLAISR